MTRKTTTIHSSLLFDPKQKAFLKNRSIEVDSTSGTIISVFERTAQHAVANDDIDLRGGGKVVMPGFVDSHTHIFLHPYDERPAAEQMRDESIVERTVRATNHCRAALLSGYTTYRDLGSEAMGAFDANLRDCINRGLTPGPRLFVATHALASTGSYEIRTENRGGGVVLPAASDAADGVAGIRAAVRRRVGDGADIIKFYADYRRKIMRFPPAQPHPYVGSVLFPPADPNPAVPLFAEDEVAEIVREARRASLPVACHAGTVEGAAMALRAGVTSLEHVPDATDELLKEMAERRCIFVPTLAAFERLVGGGEEAFRKIAGRTRRAHELGVRLAAGGDTGTFAHGEGAREMELMVEAGIPIEEVLEACMIGGWEACGGDLCGYRFGWLDKGNRADIIALETDPREDCRALRNVNFVMKDGRVWKHHGRAVGMADDHQWTDPDPWTCV